MVMRLADGLARLGWNEEHLVGRLREMGFSDVHQGTVNRIKLGRRNASVAMALAIEAVTGRVVCAEDLPLSERSRAALRAMRESDRTNLERSGLNGNAA